MDGIRNESIRGPVKKLNVLEINAGKQIEVVWTHCEEGQG